MSLAPRLVLPGRFSTAFALLLCVAPLRAQGDPPPLFEVERYEQAVLQADRPIVLRGHAPPSAEVEVTLGPTTVTAKADGEGRFVATLPPQKVQTTPLTLGARCGGHTTVARGILVGEVWLCSGQSNMEWPIKATEAPEKAVQEATSGDLRLYIVTHASVPDAAPRVAAKWEAATGERVPELPATAFYFGHALRAALGVPVGLVVSCWGGTPAEAWTPAADLLADQELAGLVAPASDPKTWEGARAGHLFNGMIAPLAGVGVRGAIWYQGESNVGRSAQYEKLLPTMIAAWRGTFGNPTLPFGIVQIAPFRYAPKGRASALLRDAQHTVASRTPHCGLAVTMDIGHPTDIHPGNKREVGARLVRWALSEVYGKASPWRGPTFLGASVEGSAMRARFAHADGLRTRDGNPPSHFEVAGADRMFHPASATLDGDSVLVRSEAVPQPVAIRYAYTDDAQPNLENGAGLPAPSFRSDSWPIDG